MNDEEAGPNGTSLASLERMLRLMIEHHEAEFKAMRIWQVIAQDHMTRLETLQQEQGKRFDAFLEAESERGERIDNLVTAIGKLIDRIPPENLR